MKKKLLFFIFVFINVLFINNTYNIHSKVAFDESMSRSYAWNPNHAQISLNWRVLRDIYSINYLFDKPDSSKLRIPKKVHWIWLGSPLPNKYKAFQDSWKKFNPDWEFKLWTDKDVVQFNMKNKALFDKSNNWGQKSDIWRYEILEREGGLYVDTDFECLKNFDILHYLCDFYTGIGYDLVDPYLYNGLIASVPGHPILKACINNVTVSNDPKNNMAIIHDTGPLLFTRIFFKNIHSIYKYKTIAFPVTYFYPLSNRDRYISYKEMRMKIRPESYAIHYYDTSWVK